MPITYEIDIPVGLIVTRCMGNITPSEVLEQSEKYGGSGRRSNASMLWWTYET
jgi:hypothetical protein